MNGDGSIRMIYAGDASVIDALDNKEEVLKTDMMMEIQCILK